MGMPTLPVRPVPMRLCVGTLALALPVAVTVALALALAMLAAM